MAIGARGRFRAVLWAALLALPLEAWGEAPAKPAKRLTWDTFGALAPQGCSIRMVLPDGVRIEGRLADFRPEAMELNVYKTSDKQAHPKGLITIPRRSASVVEMRARRHRGRLIGALIPIAAGGAMLAGGLAQSDEGILYSMLAAGGLTLGAGTPAGYLTGRAIDRRFETFVIVPSQE